MNSKSPTSLHDIFQQQGFIHTTDTQAIDGIKKRGDFDSFTQSWNNLPLDDYLKDGGKYRFRRYAVFNYSHDTLNLLPIEPHYQARKYNDLHGGFYRHYKEFLPEVAESAILHYLIKQNINLLSTDKQQDWRVQAHQFRIRATETEAGKPSPEGIHQDGAEAVFIMLVDRKNILGASNTIHNEAQDVLYETTMKLAGESILVNDKRHWHGVSKAYPDNNHAESHRDVLVLTFHKEPLNKS